MEIQDIAMGIAFVCMIIIVGLVIFGIFPLFKTMIVGMRCKHTETRRCYGDERIYHDRRCLECGKGFA